MTVRPGRPLNRFRRVRHDGLTSLAFRPDRATQASMVKRKSFLASNKEFWVRILVGGKLRSTVFPCQRSATPPRRAPMGGVCGVAVSACLVVNQKVTVRLRSDALVVKENDSMKTRTLQRPALVLNRNWQPVNVATVARRWCCCGTRRPASSTRAIFSSTRGPIGRGCVRPTVTTSSTRAVDAARAGGDRARGVQPRAEGRGGLQPAEHLQARSLDLPVLREAAGRRRADDRPRVPRSQGGVSSWENCVLACIDCNKGKADRTPHRQA